MSLSRLGVFSCLAATTILAIASACSSSSKNKGKTTDAGSKDSSSSKSDTGTSGEASVHADGSGPGTSSDSQAVSDSTSPGSGSGSCTITPGVYTIDYSAPAIPDGGPDGGDASSEPANCVPPNNPNPFPYPTPTVDASSPDATVVTVPDSGTTCTVSVTGSGTSTCVSTRICSTPLSQFTEKISNVETVTSGVPAGVTTQVVLAPDGGAFSTCTYDYQWVAVAVDAGADSAAEQ